MLDFLDREYTESGILHRFDLHMALQNTILSNSDSVQAYCEAFIHGVSELVKAGGVLADDTKLVLFMANLGTAFQAWQTNIRMQLRKSEALPTLDYLVRDLADEAKRRGQSTALLSKGRQVQAENQLPTSGRPILHCPQCGLRGHSKDRCFYLHPNLAPEGWIPQEEKKVAGIDYSSCYKRGESPSPMSSLAQRLSLSASVSPSRSSMSRDCWIVDSGSTNHMCNDRSLFTKLRPSQETVSFGMGQAKARGTGDVHLDLLRSTGETTSVVLHEVIYVPGLAANLISNSALNLCGAYYHGWEHKIVLANGTEVAHAPTVAGVPTVATRKPTFNYERSRCQRRRIKPEAIAMLQRVLQSSRSDNTPISGGAAPANPPLSTTRELQPAHTRGSVFFGIQRKIAQPRQKPAKRQQKVAHSARDIPASWPTSEKVPRAKAKSSGLGGSRSGPNELSINPAKNPHAHVPLVPTGAKVRSHGACGQGGVSQDLSFPPASGNIQCRLFSALFPRLTNLHF